MIQILKCYLMNDIQVQKLYLINDKDLKALSDKRYRLK